MKSGRNIQSKPYRRHGSPRMNKLTRARSPVKSPTSLPQAQISFELEQEALMIDPEALCREYNLRERDFWIYKSIFDMIDYKGRNQVDPMEMRLLLEHLDIDITNDRKFLYELFADLDTLGNGFFTFQDFLRLISRGNPQPSSEQYNLRYHHNNIFKKR